MKKVITLLALFCIAAFAQNTFTDPRDGKKYKTTKIGNQTWMAQNLDYHGEDGYLGLCYGDEPQKKIRKPENCEKYGRLYDWNEAMKACPKGWHLPSHKEWQTLVDFAGGDDVAGKKLKSKSGWQEHDFSEKSPNAPKCKWTEEEIDNRGRIKVTEHDKCTTDEYSFSALPGGFGRSNGNFRSVGSLGTWWSSSEELSKLAYSRNMFNSLELMFRESQVKSNLYSVRCLKN